MNEKSPNVNRTRSFGFVLGLLLFLSVFLIADVKAQAKNDQIPTVTLCEINKTPGKYTGRIVRISALYKSTFEYTALFDESCGSTNNGAEFLAACQVVGEKANESRDQAACEAFLKPISEKLSGDPFEGSYASVVVVGKVEYREFVANEHNVKIRVSAIESVSAIKVKE